MAYPKARVPARRALVVALESVKWQIKPGTSAGLYQDRTREARAREADEVIAWRGGKSFGFDGATGQQLHWSVCPLLALSGHTELHCTCPLSGAKRTWLFAPQMSAFDPKRTWTIRDWGHRLKVPRGHCKIWEIRRGGLYGTTGSEMPRRSLAQAFGR